MLDGIDAGMDRRSPSDERAVAGEEPTDHQRVHLFGALGKVITDSRSVRRMIGY